MHKPRVNNITMNDKDFRLLMEAYQSIYNENATAATPEENPYNDEIKNSAENYDDAFGTEEEEEEQGEEEHDEPRDMSDVEADADTLASAGYGTDEDYGDYGGYEESVVNEAKRKTVSSKKNVNPWAVCGKLKEPKKERCVKDVKKSAKKYGKKITSKAVRKK